MDGKKREVRRGEEGKGENGSGPDQVREEIEAPDNSDARITGSTDTCGTPPGVPWAPCPWSRVCNVVLVILV